MTNDEDCQSSGKIKPFKVFSARRLIGSRSLNFEHENLIVSPSTAYRLPLIHFEVSMARGTLQCDRSLVLIERSWTELFKVTYAAELRKELIRTQSMQFGRYPGLRSPMW